MCKILPLILERANIEEPLVNSNTHSCLKKLQSNHLKYRVLTMVLTSLKLSMLEFNIDDLDSFLNRMCDGFV